MTVSHVLVIMTQKEKYKTLKYFHNAAVVVIAVAHYYMETLLRGDFCSINYSVGVLSDLTDLLRKTIQFK